MIDTEDMLTRFLSYAEIDTHSDIHSNTTPTTQGQWTLLHQLENELIAIGMSDVRILPYGFVLATLPATTQKTNVPTVALLAHVDTSSNCLGQTRPVVHRKYNGKPIYFSEYSGLVLDSKISPLLAEKVGEDIITTSGDSLLGADNKAGIAVIMAAMKYLIAHPEIKHGPVRVCFNPDEEIGQGTEKLPLSVLAADVAYTLASESPGQVDYETFNAERAAINIRGVHAHPGWARGVMVNAILLAHDLIAKIPRELGPEHSSGRMGYIHVCEFEGNEEHVHLEIILRDFEMDGLLRKHRLIADAVSELSVKFPHARIDLSFETQYRNMRYWLEKNMRPVDLACEAIRRAGLEPSSEALRGGTDGSRLTERGLPTPSLFVGYQLMHTPLEWISLQDMEKSAETVVHLLQLWEEKS